MLYSCTAVQQDSMGPAGRVARGPGRHAGGGQVAPVRGRAPAEPSREVTVREVAAPGPCVRGDPWGTVFRVKLRKRLDREWWGRRLGTGDRRAHGALKHPPGSPGPLTDHGPRVPIHPGFSVGTSDYAMVSAG